MCAEKLAEAPAHRRHVTCWVESEPHSECQCKAQAVVAVGHHGAWREGPSNSHTSDSVSQLAVLTESSVLVTKLSPLSFKSILYTPLGGSRNDIFPLSTGSL